MKLDYTLLGARLREARKARGWTLKEAAEKADCSAEFLGALERGLCKPMLDVFFRLCILLDLSADEALAAARGE